MWNDDDGNVDDAGPSSTLPPCVHTGPSPTLSPGSSFCSDGWNGSPQTFGRRVPDNGGNPSALAQQPLWVGDGKPELEQPFDYIADFGEMGDMLDDKFDLIDFDASMWFFVCNMCRLNLLTR